MSKDCKNTPCIFQHTGHLLPRRVLRKRPKRVRERDLDSEKNEESNDIYVIDDDMEGVEMEKKKIELTLDIDKI